MTHVFSVRALSHMLRPSLTLANICPHPRLAYMFRSSQTHPAQKLGEARVPAAWGAAAPSWPNLGSAARFRTPT